MVNRAMKTPKLTKFLSKTDSTPTAIKRAEIKLCAYVCRRNLAFLTMDTLPLMCKDICNDSRIAKEVKMKLKEATQIVVGVLAPYFKKTIVDDFRQSMFTIITDETTDFSVNKSLIIIVGYWNSGSVKDRVFDLVEVESGHANVIFEVVKKILDENAIPYENVTGLGADSASVMMGNIKGVQARLKEIVPNLYVQTCLCHSLRLCTSYASKQLPNVIEQFVRDIYGYFRQSTKRSKELAERQIFANEKPHKILHPCQTRWLSLKLPEYLQITGGPANFSPRVRKALSCQTLNPVSSEMLQMMDEIREMSKYIFQTGNPLTLVIQTSGNGGNESLIRNLLDPGDKVVVAVTGFFTDLVVDMCQRHDLDVMVLRKPTGEIYSVEELERAVIDHKAALLFLTHGEPTGGTIQNLEGLGEMCHKHDCLLAVDAVVSICVVPIYVDRWSIDAITAGSQKAIGCPPGLCLMSISPRAQKRMLKKKKRPPYYYDLMRIADYWGCFENSRRYCLTFSTNSLAALREGLAEICEEGLENVWARHKYHGHLFWSKLEEIGLDFLVAKEENRFYGVTLVNIPKGIHWPTFLEYLKKKIEISPGYGPSLDKAFRMGLMGYNSKLQVIEYVTDALKKSLEHFRQQRGPFNNCSE